VRDSNGFQANGRPLNFPVFVDPTVSLAAIHSDYDSGQPFIVDASAINGSGGYRYLWTGQPAGCASTSPSLNCTTTKAGNYSIMASVTDSNGITVRSTSLLIRVAVPITVSLSPAPSSIRVGQSVTFSANATGGTGVASYAWNFGDGSQATGRTVQHAFASTGTFTVTVRATDAVGGTDQRTTSVTVASTPSPSSPAGPAASGLGTVEIVAALVAIVAAVAIVLLVRKRRRRSAEDLPPPTP